MPARFCAISKRAATPGTGAHVGAVLSVDAIRLYKPRPEVYALVTERFKIAPGETVFVSSNRRDRMGAAAVGFQTAWVNRTHLPGEYEPPPDATLAGLNELITRAP